MTLGKASLLERPLTLEKIKQAVFSRERHKQKTIERHETVERERQAEKQMTDNINRDGKMEDLVANKSSLYI